MPGVPPAVAVLIAAGCTVVGVGIDAARGTDLTKAFSVLYVLGCVAAILLVRQSGLFTAAVQPPLILFVAVPAAYQHMSKAGGTSLKDILLNDAVPLVNRFPLMTTGTVAVLAIAAVRFALARQQGAPTRERAARVSKSSGAQARAAKKAPSRGKPAKNNDTVKDKLDRISAKASALKAQATDPTRAGSAKAGPAKANPAKSAPMKAAEPGIGRKRRPESGANERVQRQHPGERNKPATAGRGIPRRETPQQLPRNDPRFPNGVAPTAASPNRPHRPRNDMPSHPMPNVRYRDRDLPPYDR